MNWGSFWIGVAVGAGAMIVIGILVLGVIFVGVTSYFNTVRTDGQGTSSEYYGTGTDGEAIEVDAVVLNPPFAAGTFSIRDDMGPGGEDAVIMEMSHNLGESLHVESMWVSGTGDSEGSECDFTPSDTGDDSELSDGGNIMVSGETYDITFLCQDSQQFKAGDAFMGDILIKYHVDGSELDQQGTGNLRGTVV